MRVLFSFQEIEKRVALFLKAPAQMCMGNGMQKLSKFSNEG
ncbi:hypothetical protein GPB2148_2424 [marine gamma proteobacterium HTCC2148]|nr:hypothetical protein GPB2148_2424 [marine gamma proteobacterium HTCC2148]